MISEHILVAVGAVVEDDKDRILLVKHTKERGGYWRGKWICPGGELEFGEEIRAGIKREIREETSLEVELVTPLPPFDRIVKLDGETSLHVIYVDYVAKLLGGELEIGSDVGEALWVEKKSISKMWPELHEDTRRLLKIAGIA
jgi:ADP-ribose pyrophosphatase YjhB (NUDIX family)